MKAFKKFLLPGFLLWLSTPAIAVTLCVQAGPCEANWQPFGVLVDHPQAPDPDGPMYFDGYSFDAPNANIGYFIAGEGAFLSHPFSPGALLPFWGNPDGSAVPSFHFRRERPTAHIQFLHFSSSWAGTNSLGWYDIDSAAWGWIVQSNGLPPGLITVPFTPSLNYGLFFVPNSSTFDPLKTYFTDSTRNGIADEDVAFAAANGILLGPELFQHFAVFQGANRSVYVGINDRSNQVGDRDYNDVVFRLVDIPEPASWALMALGLLGLLVRQRCVRRREHSS